MVGKLKRVGGFLLRSVFLPRIVRVPKGIVRSYKTIRAEMSDLGKKSVRERATFTNVKYINSASSQSAFEALVVANKWTQPELANQLKNVRIVKWVSLALAWIFLSGLIAIAFYVPFGFAFYIAFGVCWVSLICFSMQVLKMTLFQVQLQERDLIGLKALLDRSDFFKRLIS